MITFKDFAKLELRVGTVLEAEELEDSENLIKLIIDLGEVDPKTKLPINRQILAGVKRWYKAGDFVGREVIVLANLEPKVMMGEKSEGMILAADSIDGPVFLSLPKKVPAGTKIK